MEDEIVRQLNAYWEDEPETSWAAWTAGFMLKNPHQRIADLKTADQWLATQDGITREHASMLTRKRELEDLHWKLRRAGR